MSSIIELEEKVRGLSQDEKGLLNRIFDVSSYVGRLNIPSSFREKAIGYFKIGDESDEDVIKRLKEQKVVRVFNKWSLEGAVFNELRASRPGMKTGDVKRLRDKVDEHVNEKRQNCDLCNPEQYTSEDIFGRVRGEHCITGSNVAKYDAWNGMIYFDKHHPLDFNEDEFSDYIETAFKWFEKVHETNEEFKFPFLMWNCLEKAAASQVHGHMHSLMTRDRFYAKVMALRDASQRYGEKHKSDYFDDLFKVHDSVGLAIPERESGNSKVFVYLTPIKEKETFVVVPCNGFENKDSRKDLRESVFKVLRCFIDEFGVHSFNVGISIPSIDGGNGGFPYVARIVDRGSIFKKNADMGGMELYGDSVVAVSPNVISNSKITPKSL